MKFVLATILTALLSFLLGMFLPWWTIAIAAFIAAIIFNQTLGKAFLAGFTGVFLLWAIIALVIDLQNESVLSYKIAQLFPLGGSSILLIMVTALIGGLVGGFAAMAGAALRPVKKKKRVYY